MSAEHIWGENPLDEPGADPLDIAKKAAFEIAVATGIGHHDIAILAHERWTPALNQVGKTTEEFPAHDITGFTPPLGDFIPTIRSVILSNNKRALVFVSAPQLSDSNNVRQVVHPVRVAAASGSAHIVLATTSHGLRPAWSTGTVVMIRDHLNMTSLSPIESSTFIDLTDVYSKKIRARMSELTPSLQSACVAQVSGPNVGSNAELQMYRHLGAEVVSTQGALETIAARQSRLEVSAVTVLTSDGPMADRGSLAPLTSAQHRKMTTVLDTVTGVL
jgi:purine-nucleoside phosphorylase